MQHIAFAAAAKPATARVLRLRMLNYSIGHELILLNKRNPIATLSAEDFLKLPDAEQIKAVHQAVLICSRTWEQNDEPNNWLWLWRKTIRESDLKTAVLDFLSYRFKGSTFPKINKPNKQPEGRTLGSPFLVRVLNCVDGDFNYPLGAAQWRYFSKLEDDGRVEVENEGEAETAAEIAQHEADYAKEQEALRQR